MTREEFTRRFIAYMCDHAGFTHFDATAAMDVERHVAVIRAATEGDGADV